MNKKQWTGLLMVYVSYLLLGATAFYFIERDREDKYRKDEYEIYVDINDKIERAFFGDERDTFRQKLGDYCGKTFEKNKDIEEIVPIVWNFYNSFFFVVTVVSTIGYGNLHPTTDPGRSLMIVYAIIGIPLNGILLSSLGQFFGAVFLKAHRKYKSHRDQYGKRCKLAVNVLTYLAPGLIIFIFLPAGVFSYFENWSYIEGVYFAFVTLTTIGFGDLVAGQGLYVGFDTTWVLIYRIALIFWVIFGLGYLIMLLGFVAQALTNKKVIEMEKKILANLTHSKFWSGFTKDVSYLRRFMNEIYLEKLKPVFRDEKHPLPQIIHRSKSLPDVFKNKGDETPHFPRRERAMSEHIPQRMALVRVFSETDLHRIDKNATFAAASTVPTTFELMKRVIDAYAGAQVRDWSSGDTTENGPEGVEGFSNDEILASETWHTNLRGPKYASSIFDIPSYQDTVSRQPHRGRAMSECPDLNEEQPSTNPAGPVDWTWSGPNANKFHDIIKQRSKQRLLKQGRSGSISSTVLAGARKLNPLRKRRRCVTETNSQETDLNINGDIPKHTLSVPNDIGRKRRSLPGEGQVPKIPSYYMTAIPGATGSQQFNRMYNRENWQRRDILEETSLADFLTVLTTLHSRVGERLVTADNQPKPRRKMGTASLTPPRISSLLELFHEPTLTPKMQKRRKPSKIMNIFRTDSKREGTETDSNSTPEPSNLKRFGRFLLRSYSTTPKDAEEIPKTFLKRKRFSLWPGESDDKNSPPFQLQVDSPSETSNDVTITIEPDDCSSTPIYPRKSSTGPGMLFPPGETSPATRRRTNSTVSKKSSNSRHFDPPDLK